MNRRPRLRALIGLALSLLLMLLAFPRAASAKGAFGLVVISGGLAADIEVTDRHLLDFGSFNDFSQSLIEAPADPGTGYVISRGWPNDAFTPFAPWDRLRYYPGAAGQPGYVFYEGLVNGSSEYDGHWYRASADAEKYMLPLLAAQLAPAAPAPAVPLSSFAPFLAVLVLSALLAVGLAAQAQRGKTIHSPAG